jgi:hypothetical protein
MAPVVAGKVYGGVGEVFHGVCKGAEEALEPAGGGGPGHPQFSS